MEMQGKHYKRHKPNDAEQDADNTVLVNIYDAIRQIRYGSIQIHIQDGKIVQIDKVDKMRVR